MTCSATAWLPHDGKVIPKEVPLALAKEAANRGAQVIEGVRVLDLEQRDGRVTAVVTDQGRIEAVCATSIGSLAISAPANAPS